MAGIMFSKEEAIKWTDDLYATSSIREQITSSNVVHKKLSMDIVSRFLEMRYNNTEVLIFNNDVCACTIKACRNAVENKGVAEVGDKIAVLDFASYTNPGGGFIKGAMAQEEAICAGSGLYPILERNHKIYDDRKKNGFTSLYDDDLIYCETVPFLRNWTNGKSVSNCVQKGYAVASVIVAAAPNSSRCRKEKQFSEKEIKEALFRRMELIYLWPFHFGANTLVLGAFGCGVFGNNVTDVAKRWKELTKRYNGLYKLVIHPVLDKSQCEEFRKIFK